MKKASSDSPNALKFSENVNNNQTKVLVQISHFSEFSVNCYDFPKFRPENEKLTENSRQAGMLVNCKTEPFHELDHYILFYILEVHIELYLHKNFHEQIPSLRPPNKYFKKTAAQFQNYPSDEIGSKVHQISTKLESVLHEKCSQNTPLNVCKIKLGCC